MYNPAGMATSVRDTGIWGPTLTPSINTNIVFDPIPAAPLIPFPVLKIAPNDSVPMNNTGPVPGSGQSWWNSFKDSVENGAVWFGNSVSEFVTGDPIIEEAAPPPTAADTNGATMLLVAGAVAILLIKGR
ncbi:hypothetical protein [Asticcacaulis sp.]|uniref:hypothetical protein n=1 Tax=Asticcacaulis sp. TaxID=1872648 RepID=UPI00261554EF|nr:hypothetical protein [Asticcacaulis sp.]